VKAPVPGTVLRLTASDGQDVAEGDEILVMDVMKMETPITAPCAGKVAIRVAIMDTVATGDIVAMVG
jgi:biotin carboxyl carrier protein